MSMNRDSGEGGVYDSLVSGNSGTSGIGDVMYFETALRESEKAELDTYISQLESGGKLNDAVYGKVRFQDGREYRAVRLSTEEFRPVREMAGDLDDAVLVPGHENWDFEFKEDNWF